LGKVEIKQRTNFVKLKMYKEKREINTRNTWDRNTNPAQIGL
jgi:hypothetical protein